MCKICPKTGSRICNPEFCCGDCPDPNEEPAREYPEAAHLQYKEIK